MGVSAGPAPTDGRKPVDAELNLVPFIDLLVCCICFLLITAVWWQMSTIPVRHGGGPVDQQAIDRPTPLTVFVADSGYTLVDGATRLQIPKRGVRYDLERFGRQLRDLRLRHAAVRLTIAVADGVPYRELVRAMDVARTHNIAAIRVSDARLHL